MKPGFKPQHDFKCLFTTEIPSSLDVVMSHSTWSHSAGSCDGAHSTAERSHPAFEVRGSSREELPHARGQGRWPNSREELPHARGQGRWPGGAIPPPRSGGCVGAGGPRGAIPRSRSEGAAVRRYPSSKVRSSSCALLEQPLRDTPRPR